MAIQSAEARFYTGIRSWCVDKNATAAISSTSTINAVVQRIKRTYADLEAAVSIGLTNERYKTYGGGNNVITPGNPRVIDNTNNAKINSSLVCKFPTYIRIDLEKLQLPEATTCAIQFEEGWVLEGDFPGSTFAASPAVPEFFIFRTPWFSGDLKFNTTSSLTSPIQRRRPGSAAASSSSSIYARGVLNPGDISAIEVSDFAMIPRPNFTASFSSTLNSMFGPTNLVSFPIRIKQLGSNVYSESNLNLPEFDVVSVFSSDFLSQFNSNISSENSRIRYLLNQTLNSNLQLSSQTTDSRRRNTSSNSNIVSSLSSSLSPYIRLINTISNPTSSPSSRFAGSMAMSGDNIIVGDPSNTYDESGIAYVYSASTGALIQTFNNPNSYGTTYQDNFGSSVAINGNYAVVGAPDEDTTNGVYRGAAYVFNISTGALIYTLKNEVDSTEYLFGSSLAISDSYIVVGQERDGVKVYSTTTGSLLWTLPIDSDSGWRSYKVDISGDNIIVGANHYISTNNWEYRIYQYSASTGSLIRIISNPNPYGTETNDYFGNSVAVYDNYAIVGAYGEDISGTSNVGKAYIFNLTTGALVHTLSNPNPSTSDYFGQSVDLNHRYAIISDFGFVHIYNILDGSLEKSVALVPETGFPNENPLVSISGNKFAVGVGQDFTGKVKVYSF